MSNSPYDRERVQIDLAALAEFNAGVMFSRLAYEREKPATDRPRLTLTERRARFQARRNEAL